MTKILEMKDRVMVVRVRDRRRGSRRKVGVIIK